MEFDTNRGPTAKQHTIVIIELNVVTCPTYPEKFMRCNVVEPFNKFPLSLSRCHVFSDGCHDNGQSRVTKAFHDTG